MGRMATEWNHINDMNCFLLNSKISGNACYTPYKLKLYVVPQKLIVFVDFRFQQTNRLVTIKLFLFSVQNARGAQCFVFCKERADNSEILVDSFEYNGDIK